MKPSLQLKVGQQLAMTPQLQQAIRLLQLSTLELNQEIQQALEENPLLERDDNSEESQSSEATQSIESIQSTAESNDSEIPELTQDQYDVTSAISQTEMPNELPVDTTWDDLYSANTGSVGIASNEDIPVYQGETTESLQDYLIWQLNLTPFSAIDNSIAIAIIEAIDEQGFLTVSTDEILESVGLSDITIDEVEAVLKRIQQFDPLSVGSRNLQECLLLQLATYPETTDGLECARLILTEHINLLANRDFRQLMRVTKLKEPELKAVMELIHHLNPRPGNRPIASDTEYVIPDVSVFKHQGEWQVTINPDSSPRLRVNQQYAALGKSCTNSEDSLFIRNNLQDAKWLIKSLESRNETLLKVARCIVEHQVDFFELGEEAMKPMVLNDIATIVEMHESTISRVTTHKYMHTPRGIFELKYFFSSHVSTADGGECSSTVIRALVKKLIAAENSAKPLSDSKIVALLTEQNIKVARRTIAKYRESLGIAPSNQRKRLI
ncbi:RNA polymerase factor sigma-54 [Vibrio sp. SS-MA-C1-2]|uniref:RNA polymerase factor sigma-54 n=1 Tax=Vibrio sp. SS-MA-C1-2 TaxID=2908646 RepID=UPI001F3C2A0E|nr:RNA polymerase factor sigma-54 [Vibrio sp. SS-MA-C1-2]UJF19583.1 RNA polymerase factor sigma-54 [Vibrio sp. SS-MA-C1-2]